MGGSSKKVTVGYKYYLGMHMILCHGPADRLIRIEVDGRPAWKGINTGGRVNVNAPSLFGGEEREGGVSGAVDLEMGGATQGKNDYLQSRLGQNIPAFRGVVGAVLRQCYLGVNPYLKPWAFRLQRIFKTSDGSQQWYGTKAAIPGYTDEGFSIAFCIDQSGSMLEQVSAGVTRMDVQVAQTAATLRALSSAIVSSGGSIAICGYGLLEGFLGGEPDPQNFFRYNVSAKDVEDAAQFVEGLYAQVQSDTDWRVGMESARDFFAAAPAAVRKDIIFMTDGQPGVVGMDRQTVTNETVAIRNQIGGVNVWCIGIDTTTTSYLVQVDNTPQDGVPTISTASGKALEEAILNALGEIVIYDMNPAHIIRECLTDPDWGMGYLPVDIDDASFTASADQLYSESMGISILWDRQIAIEDFVKEIIRHINGALYVDRYTGKFTLKLIRNDYDKETLLTLGPRNIQKVSGYSRIDPGDSVNSVSVVYWNGKSGTNGSVTADDVALIQAYGAVINTTVQYPGFTNPAIASRAAARDLQTLSSPLLSCTIEANREAADLNIGDVFNFEWPDYHAGPIVMRVHQVAYGDGKKNRVKITATEDVFALPVSVSLGEEESGWVEPGGQPLPPPVQLAFESPYYELIQTLGETQVTDQLATTPEIGYLQVAASRPENGINARLWVDSGAGYEDSATLDFCPSATLETEIGIEDTSFNILNGSDLDLVAVGTHAEINGELVRIDSLDIATGAVTVGRAILDTIPKRHPAGTPILFWDAYTTNDGTEYVAGEAVSAKFLTNSGQGTLSLATANASSFTFANRAIRPYRPANYRAGGFLEPLDSWFPIYPVTLTWAHRNRLQETAGVPLEWTAGTITPEAGTTYDVRIEALDVSKQLMGEVTTVTGITAETFDVTDAVISSSPYPGAIFIRASVTTKRDGYSSWMSPQLVFRGPFQAPVILYADYRDPQPPINIFTSVLP